jgi:ubiquinone/menaquinone biosynthesis C-methylase UbiE
MTIRLRCTADHFVLIGFLIFLSLVSVSAQADPMPKVPPPLTHYLGREIARTMSYHGAPWLIRNEREREERCSLMLTNLGVKRGMTVCDMGCGNGFYSLQLAKMVGEKGSVLGVDIQPEMLKLLRERMEKQGIENVTPILGSLHNPHLPKGQVDLILLVDVYHEFSHPAHMLDAMLDSLAPGGQIVLLEYREEDPDVPIKPLHKMSKKQVKKELTANGFKLVKEFDKLPWQHMLFFGRDMQEPKNVEP